MRAIERQRETDRLLASLRNSFAEMWALRTARRALREMAVEREDRERLRERLERLERDRGPV